MIRTIFLGNGDPTGRCHTAARMYVSRISERPVRRFDRARLSNATRVRVHGHGRGITNEARRITAVSGVR